MTLKHFVPLVLSLRKSLLNKTLGGHGASEWALELALHNQQLYRITAPQRKETWVVCCTMPQMSNAVLDLSNCDKRYSSPLLYNTPYQECQLWNELLRYDPFQSAAGSKSGPHGTKSWLNAATHCQSYDSFKSSFTFQHIIMQSTTQGNVVRILRSRFALSCVCLFVSGDKSVCTHQIFSSYSRRGSCIRQE